MPMILLFLLFVISPPQQDYPVLRVGETLSGEITDEDPQIHTEVLRKFSPGSNVLCNRYRLEELEPGPYKVQVHSLYFQSYLIVRDQDENIINEYNHGFYWQHSQIPFEKNSETKPCIFDVCAPVGRPGPYRVTLLKGEIIDLKLEDMAARISEDIEELKRIVETHPEPESLRIGYMINELGTVLMHEGRLEEAQTYLDRALRVLEKQLPPVHPELAKCYKGLGYIKVVQGNYSEGLVYYQQALEIAEKVSGPNQIYVCEFLLRVGKAFEAQGNYEQTLEYFRRAHEIYEKTLGPDHPQITVSLNFLAEILTKLGRYDEAKPLCERSIRTSERVLGPDHRYTADALGYMASLLEAQGKYKETKDILERVLKVRKWAYGPQHLRTRATIIHLAGVNRTLGNFVEAKEGYAQVLEMVKKISGPEHVDTASALSRLAAVHRDLGEYNEAEAMLERSLEIFDLSLGPEHFQSAGPLVRLANLLIKRGEYNEAQPLIERAIKIYEKALGPEHLNTISSTESLALIHYEMGRYTEAIALYERALKIKEKALGPEHAGNGATYTCLGRVLRATGKYAEASIFCERALKLTEREYGPEHHNTARCLINLAGLRKLLGNFEVSEKMFDQALAIYEKNWDPDHPDMAALLHEIVLLHRAQGNFIEAKPMLERALRIYENVLGSENPVTANCMLSLGELYHRMGDYPKAKTLYEQALDIHEKLFGPEYPSSFRGMKNLALLLRDQGQFAEAKPLMERGLETAIKILGPGHPSITEMYNHLALLYLDFGEIDSAWEVSKQAIASAETQRQRTFWFLTEHERLLYAKQQQNTLDILLSLSRTEQIPDADQEVYQVFLQWKGRVSQSLLQNRERMKRNQSPETAELLVQLTDIKSAFSNELYRTDIKDLSAHKNRVEKLLSECSSLETRIHRLMGEDEEEANRINVETLQQALPDQGMFVDFFVQNLYTPSKGNQDSPRVKGSWTEPRLSAWVMRKRDGNITYLDLGPTQPIQKALQTFLGEINRDSHLFPKANDTLRDLLWQPLATHLKGIDTVFVSPDGFLGSLPLETIRLDGGEYLIDRHTFVYLQDMTSLAMYSEESGIKNNPSLLLVGAVDYNSRGDLAWMEPDQEPPSAPAQHHDDYSKLFAKANLSRGQEDNWPPLPATLDELKTIFRIHKSQYQGKPKTLELKGMEATEERIKVELPKYNMVHFATHGFFQPRWLPSLWEIVQQKDEQSLLDKDKLVQPPGLLPGFLSGLVLAGSNSSPQASRDDGYLTAEEIMWLDLSNVDLAVLSACETGLGSMTSGEGMLGLSRSLRQAGVDRVIASLWKVDDQAASRFFAQFYNYLWKDRMNPAKALRKVKLDMLHGTVSPESQGSDRGLSIKSEKRRDDFRAPYFWGSFVYYGDNDQ